MAKCTNVTYLMKKKDGDATFEKLLDITEYPDLGGEKEKLDVTTLSDKKKRTINGIEDTGDLNFKAWYELADYKKLLAIQESARLKPTRSGLEKRVLTVSGSGPVLWRYIRTAVLQTTQERCRSLSLMRAKRHFIL